jgi:Pentapeptide repeats (9 copies)
MSSTKTPEHTIKDIFELSTSAYGSPHTPTKEGFKKLALSGKKIWNAWRAAYPEPIVDFSEVQFDENINFSGFVFKNDQGQGPDFRASRFLKDARFRSAVMGDFADFSSAIFCSRSDFSECIFGDEPDFSQSHFEKSSIFAASEFGDGADFSKSLFKNSASFVKCTFGQNLSFFRTTFGWRTTFSHSTFGTTSQFIGATFGSLVMFDDCNFKGDCDFSAAMKEDSGKSSRQFHRISFGGCRFGGVADFSGREFRSSTYFGAHQEENKRTPVVFEGPPLFHECQLHQDTCFDGAEFRSPPSPKTARAYRTLKLAMEKLKATQEEQLFFRLEMEAEHPNLPSGRRWISAVYGWCSAYGFSLLRPLRTLLGIMLAMGIFHGLLANSFANAVNPITNGDIDWNRTLQWFRYVMINTFPVPGFDKTQLELRHELFGSGTNHGGFLAVAAILEMLHKVISLGCVFLMGLALRNMFKMKS